MNGPFFARHSIIFLPLRSLDCLLLPISQLNVLFSFLACCTCSYVLSVRIAEEEWSSEPRGRLGNKRGGRRKTYIYREKRV